jgi:amino acid permease
MASPLQDQVLYTIYSEVEPLSKWQERRLVVATAGPLLLAIAGSSLLPLPCAFGQVGFAAGTVLTLLIAAVNDYTTVLMVRAAARLGVSSYEEAVLGSAGRTGLLVARISLVVLLFGSLCGNQAAISETASRALQLAGYEWLASQHALILCGAMLLVMPPSLNSLTEMVGLSMFGVGMMLVVTGYLLYVCVSSDSQMESFELGVRLEALPEAASTFGFAFYVQPCVLPMLRSLPPGPTGARVLERATHLTYVIILFIYFTVGAAGLLYFGRDTPQDVLQGFGGNGGALISGLFCLYLAATYAPIAVPLRESLVRLWLELRRGRGTPLGSPALMAEFSRRVEHDAVPNAVATCIICGLVFVVALVLPDASAALFALTGATGVCMVAYVLPAWTHLAGARRARWARTDGAADGVILQLVVGVGLLVSLLTLVSIAREWAGAQEQTCASQD